MSDRARSLVAFALAAAAIATVAPGTARSQDAAAALERYRAAYERSERAESVFVQLRDGGDRYGSTVTAAGVTVMHAATILDDAERARLTAGLEQGVAALRDRFGDVGVQLVDSLTLYLQGYIGFGGRLRIYELSPSRRTTYQRIRLNGPLDPDEVADFVVRVAGDRVARLAPGVARYAHSRIDLAPDDGMFEAVARELALSWSAAGRRCSGGSIEACRAVLTPASGAAALDLWFDAIDHRSVIVAANDDRARIDSAYYVERERCYGGDDAACTRLVPRVTIKDPFSANIRASFAAHALETGGRGALDRLEAASAAGLQPLAALAAAAGTDEDTVIASWQARAASALVDARTPMVPMVLTTAAWCGIILFGATRRRP